MLSKRRQENWLYQNIETNRMSLQYGQMQWSSWKMGFNNFNDFVIFHHEDVTFVNHELIQIYNLLPNCNLKNKINL